MILQNFTQTFLFKSEYAYFLTNLGFARVLGILP